MRKTFSIVLDIVAGFFLYGTLLFGFMNELPTIAKWIIIFVFMIAAIIPLYISRRLKHFQYWERETGIVFMCAAGFTLFGIFTLVCMFMTEEMQKLMRHDLQAAFSNYITGFGMILVYAGFGFLLFRTDPVSDTQTQDPEA
jgi:hypothetical protein